MITSGLQTIGLELKDSDIRNHGWLYCICIFSPCILFGQYSKTEHRAIEQFETAINKPGNYGKVGATYVLTADISCEQSAIFLGKDVTLDLNGYTITYADANYNHIPNAGFEDGLRHWDVSKAPGAKVVNTKDAHVFVGAKILSLRAGDELGSEYIYLPVANRSYFAMCGITGHYYSDMRGDLANEMKISLFVEDENEHSIIVNTAYGDGIKPSCPVLQKSPRLGGGFITAHLNNLPTGRYRIRVRAEVDCLIDEVDIRPAMDVGIGIVGETHPYGSYEDLYEIVHSAFFDYTDVAVIGKPAEGIPVVEGRGTILIKNGIIKNGTNGVLSWGIQSTASDVRIILDNVHIISSGINCTAVDVPQAAIKHCFFEVDNPFLINRHGSQYYAVDLRGPLPSEVAYSEFMGGQGCLVFKGKYSSIHDNYFVNHQMVTNHYSIMAIGDSSHIFQNIIEPEVGSGIEIFVHKGMAVFSNRIKVKSSPPTCEYGQEEYSVAAIRIADYNASPGSERSASENKLYNNTIYVEGRDFPEFPKYKPMAWAVFYSASGGENYIFGNEIYVDQKDPSSKAEAAAFYVCPGLNGKGGSFYDNQIYTNVPAAWIATMYGGTANTNFSYNKIYKWGDTGIPFKPFRMGWDPCTTCYAKNILFNSNQIDGAAFDIDMTDQDHSFEIYWTLKINISDGSGKPVADSEIFIEDKSSKVVGRGNTDIRGEFTIELLDYIFENGEKKIDNTYLVKCNKKAETVILDQDMSLTIIVD
ncbi:MAG: hypothetical protein IPL46_21795 [Saprospiraceae bacterium]|nr:hypothetical protein [Saprospiraceae bacterium]